MSSNGLSGTIHTTMKNTFYIALILLCSFPIIGCEPKDGGWDPIQITVNGNRCKSATYKVPAEGGEYRISSRNYGGLWLNDVRENGTVVWPENYDWSDYKNINLTGEWYEVTYDKDDIVVSIHAKGKSVESRSLTFSVECGDAFGHITLLQE